MELAEDRLIADTPQRDVIGVIALVLLYPGFYFYNTAIALGQIPAVLGGYYGLTAALLLPLLLLHRFVVWERGGLKLVAIDVVFTAIVIFMAVWSLIHRYDGFGYQSDPRLMTVTRNTIILMITNYAIGRRLVVTDRLLQWILVASAAAMLVIAVTKQSGGAFDARTLDTSGATSEVLSTYQGFARSALVTLLLLMGTVRRAFLPWLYAIGLILLFLLGARSEFGAFVLAGLVGMYLRSGGIRFTAFIGPVVAAAVVLLADVALREARDSRIFNLLALDQDTSANARRLQLEFAIEALKRSPLLGDYGSYLLAGGMGSYAHNLLSAWVDFGLIGFLGFSWITFVPLVRMLPRARARVDMTPTGYVAVSFGLAMSFLAIISKSMYEVSIPLVWGLYANYVERQRS